MIVEFTGCTSSGKSQIVQQVLGDLRARGVSVRLAEEVFSRRLGLPRSSSALQTFIFDCLLLPYVLRDFVRRPHIFLRSLVWIATDGNRAFTKLNILRNVLKNLALYAYVVKRTRSDELVLMDEGTIHSLHKIFVHYQKSPNLNFVRKAIEILPVPDRIILVEALPAQIVERALKRPDPPWPGLDAADWSRVTENARRVFEELKANPKTKARIFCVSSSDESAEIVLDYFRKFETNSALPCLDT